MRKTAIIAWREMVHHRILLAAAVAASVLALAARWLPSIGRYSVNEVTVVVAGIIAMLLVVLYSLGLGATFLGRDLSEGRLGFYFARPVSGLAIWTGRLVAIYLLVIASGIIVLLPACLISPTMIEDLREYSTPLVLLIFPLALILLAHTLSVMLRARSAWIVADLTAPMVLAALCWRSVYPLWRCGATHAAWVCITALGVSVVLGMVVAGAVQVVVGRTSLRRAHRTLSMSLWGLLAFSSLAVAGYSSWLQRCEPEELWGVSVVVPAPHGDWIAVSGSAMGHLDYDPSFLLNVETGSFIQLPKVPRLGMFRSEIKVVFSRDGSSALLPEGDSSESPRRAVRVDLGTGTPRRRDSLLVVDAYTWACSADITRIAQLESTHVHGRMLLTVYDLDEERLLLSAPFPQVSSYDVTMVFFDNDHLRIYLEEQTPVEQNRVLRIFEADISSGALRQTGQVDSVLGWPSPPFSLDASLMLVRRLAPNESTGSPEVVVTAHDSLSGEIDTSFDTTHLAGSYLTQQLIDGRVLAVVHEQSPRYSDTPASLRIIDSKGDLLHEIDLGMVYQVSLGSQPTRRTAEITLWSASSTEEYRQSYEVDLDTGRLDRISTELRPSWCETYSSRGLWLPYSVVPDHLYYYEQYQALLVYTPASGEWRYLTGRSFGMPIPARIEK